MVVRVPPITAMFSVVKLPIIHSVCFEEYPLTPGSRHRMVEQEEEPPFCLKNIGLKAWNCFGLFF